MSDAKVKFWGTGNKVLTKTYSTTDENAKIYYKVMDNGSMKIFKRTTRKKMNTYDQGYSDVTLAYYSARAWHSVE